MELDSKKPCAYGRGILLASSTPGSGTLTSSKDGDTWYLSINDNEYYVVPEAAIFGG